MDTTRVETFSDGVLAVAITLLVLNLQPPDLKAGESLWQALQHLWPNYAAYVVSFFVIGIIWVNHHSLFRVIAQADRSLLFFNLLLLLVVAVLPFSTALLAKFVQGDNADAHAAAAVYSLNMLGMALAFTLLVYWVTRNDRLLHPHLASALDRSNRRRFSTVGVVVYLAAVGLSFISAPVTLLVHFVIAMYYVLDQLPVGKRSERPEASGS